MDRGIGKRLVAVFSNGDRIPLVFGAGVVDICQGGAAAERADADGCQAGGQKDGAELRTVIEGGSFDHCNAVGQNDTAQAGTMIKCTYVNGR